MSKKKPVTTKRGQHHQYKSFWINLIKDINLTKIDTNVVRKHPDSFEKKKVRLEKRNSDPFYFRQTVLQEFQSLSDGVEFSFWRLSKNSSTLIPLPPEIDNAASLCNYDELNRSSLYIRLQAPPRFVTPCTSSTQPHQILEPIDSTEQQAQSSITSQGTNALQNNGEMLELLAKEKSTNRGSEHSLRVHKKRKITSETDQEFMGAKDLNLHVANFSKSSSVMQESSFLGKLLEDIYLYRDTNGVSSANAMDFNTVAVPGQFTHDASVPLSYQHQVNFIGNGEFSSNRPNHGNRDQPQPMIGHPVPQLYRPQLDNGTWDSSQRSMVVPYPMQVSNLYSFIDSTILPEQQTMQYLHQQRPNTNLFSLSAEQNLHSQMLQTQEPPPGLDMVPQNASNSENTCVSQENASNVSQVPCAQPRGVIQIERADDICNFAAMNGKVYITYSDEDALLVYSSSSPFKKEKEVKVNGMKHPGDIAAFAEENCLFISDGKVVSSQCIWMVTDGEEVVCKKFVEDIGCYRLSVTHDGELLIVSNENNCIHLYNSDGRCFCCVKLPDEFNSYVPVYAAKSLRESFYVSVVWTTEYKNNKTLYSMVYKLSMDGDIVKTFGGREGRGSGQLRYSYHPMAVDKHGRVIVGDAGNDRILMLDSNLQLLTIILDKDDLKDGFRFEKVRMDANASFIFVEDERHDIRIFNFSEFQPNRMNETSSNIFSRAMPGTDKFHLLFSIEGKESDDGEESDEIRGVATLAYSIYILKRCSITVYDSTNPYIKKYYGAFDGDLWDIAANAYDGCLYVTDKEKKCIWSADIDLRRKKWLEGIGSPYTLSVARDGSVLILSNKDQSLSIYDKDGLQPQSRIRFSCKRTMHLQHAVKLSYSRGHETYLVCHGLSVSQDTIDEYDYIYDSFVLSHEVFVASANGDILQTFGGKLGSSSNQLNLPSHIVVYKDDTMLVADCNNNRVLRLDHQLNLQNIPLSKDVHSIDEPFRVCYSENTGQIIVANSNSVDIFVNDDFRRCQGEDDSDSAVNNDTSESEMPCVQLIGQVADIQLQKDKTCRGAAVLQDHMYLIYDYTDTVYVYSSDHPYELLSQIVHQQMEDPICIVASVEHNCVYVADESTIWRLVRNGQECETFLSFDYMCSISINEEGHLLVAYYVDNDSFVSTYDADGRCIQVIGFLPRRDIYYAVKSGSKTVFVNWHSSDKKCDAMSEVSLNGDLLHTYGPHINEYFRCIGMSLGEDDQILVNDKSNGGRILVFGSRARLIGVLLGKDDHQMTQITGLCYIKDKKQLLVIGPDRVNIYQLNKNQGPQIDGHYRKVALDVEDPTPSNGDTGQLLYSRIPGDEDGQLCVRAVGKLGEKHYLLYSNSFEVFSRQDLVTKVEFGEGALEIPKSRYCNSDNGGLWDIAASETDLCLYVSDRYNHCVWSVSIDHKIKKWLANIGSPYTLSVTEDGSLCILSNYHKYLHLYDRSGNKKTSIELPRYMKYLLHAVQTPKGTYVVSWTENIQEGAYDGTRRNASNFVKKKSDTKKDPEKQGDGSDTKMDDDEEEEEEEEEEEKKKKKDEQQLLDHEDVVFEESHKSCVCSEESETQKRGLVCEISSDGSTLRSFRANPQHDQIDTCDSRYLFQLEIPCYLALDQEGRVLVADYHGSNRVLLLDSQLKFLANVTEKFQLESYKAKRLCYDINSKELTVIQSRCGFPSSIMCIRM